MTRLAQRTTHHQLPQNAAAMGGVYLIATVGGSFDRSNAAKPCRLEWRQPGS